MPCLRACEQQLSILRCFAVQALVALFLVVGFFQVQWRRDFAADLNLTFQPLGSERSEHSLTQLALPPSLPPRRSELELADKAQTKWRDRTEIQLSNTDAPAREQSDTHEQPRTNATVNITDAASQIGASLSSDCLNNPRPRFPDHRNHSKKVPAPRNASHIPLLTQSVLHAGTWRALAEDFNHTLVHRLLLRLHRNESVRIEAYGGSMTAGGGCNPEAIGRPERKCSWPSLLLDHLTQAFPGASVTLANHAQGGATIDWGIQEMVATRFNSDVVPDMIVCDFDQNGGGDHEPIVRAVHHFLPSTLVVLLETGDRQPLVPKLLKRQRNVKDTLVNEHRSTNLKLAAYYSMPFISFADAELEHVRAGGSFDELWPAQSCGARRLCNLHHPPWFGHAYVADLLAYWLNVEYCRLHAHFVDYVEHIKAHVPPPVLRRPKSLEADNDWLKPINAKWGTKQIGTSYACLNPLASHFAQRPNDQSPKQSIYGSWKLYEDRPNKPGWITTELSKDSIVFPVKFGDSPLLIISMLRSYERIGQAKMQLTYASGTSKPWVVDAAWGDRVSLTFAQAYKLHTPGGKLPVTSDANLSFQLVTGSKYKIISVISC